ncbi:MAG: hypothetical protein K0U98_14310 [Deltaproteobacteria bacterium]|nr:hypothetical protein [Deltaproteobacteria bacterium]
MTDQDEFSNPFPAESWEHFAVFRESFLTAHFNPTDADAFRRIGRLAYLLTLSGDQPASESQGSRLSKDLRGAARDLRWLQGFLQDVGRQHEEAELAASEAALSRRAAEVAVRIGAFALELEVVLGAGA